MTKFAIILAILAACGSALPQPELQPLPQPELQPLPQPELQPLPQPELQPLPQPELQPLPVVAPPSPLLNTVTSSPSPSPSPSPADAEGEYSFEWEYYAADVVVDHETSNVQVLVEEVQTSIQEVVETYVEYEYEYEYEYEGSLALGGEAIGKLSDKELPCPIHFIRDCGDFCAPAYWIGNGLCDDGGENTGKIGAANFPFVKEGNITYMPDTNPNNLNKPENDRASGDRVAYNFNCPQFWQDGGDCNSKDEAIQSGFDTRIAAALYLPALHLEVGGRQLGVPTLAIAVMAIVGIAGVAMRR